MAAIVKTAGFDPLGDEGAVYAARLAAEGTTLIFDRFSSQSHRFATMSGLLPASEKVAGFIDRGLRVLIPGANIGSYAYA